MPVCDTCKQPYDNGTNSLHGCDPMALLLQFRVAFGQLSVGEIERLKNQEAGYDLLDLYLRVRRMLDGIEEATR